MGIRQRLGIRQRDKGEVFWLAKISTCLCVCIYIYIYFCGSDDLIGGARNRVGASTGGQNSYIPALR